MTLFPSSVKQKMKKKSQHMVFCPCSAFFSLFFSGFCFAKYLNVYVEYVCFKPQLEWMEVYFSKFNDNDGSPLFYIS